jgi:hypothetical protein
MSAWTPEPWRAGFSAEHEVIIRAEEMDGQPYVAHLLGDNTEANARRIIACVNACRDVPTEAVEALQPGWWQRNVELLAAAEGLLDAIDRDDVTVAEFEGRIRAARAAIARTRAETPPA